MFNENTWSGRNVSVQSKFNESRQFGCWGRTSQPNPGVISIQKFVTFSGVEENNYYAVLPGDLRRRRGIFNVELLNFYN